MIIRGIALKGAGVVSKYVAMALAPVVAVLAWGAVEQAMDDRHNQISRTTKGV
ncbi:hypothetical protein [Actinomycetospora atypica]|uniref:Uncharacterized protein n=1 Tax=Actinomycetospora atypica TaxID=1290095 RepID=A0ABV9YIQ4_9PSEU